MVMGYHVIILYTYIHTHKHKVYNCELGGITISLNVFPVFRTSEFLLVNKLLLTLVTLLVLILPV